MAFTKEGNGDVVSEVSSAEASASEVLAPTAPAVELEMEPPSKIPPLELVKTPDSEIPISESQPEELSFEPLAGLSFISLKKGMSVESGNLLGVNLHSSMARMPFRVFG
ncbi:hypothetical protein AMTR_s00141p00084440 [Amborella trichopoda]|uniref:Uncharacterized protein n=1 Tax=Amborella trichopoda TaxID=13333 RepID=W1PIS4_AMBTC|nr:hypothetical protein AMTR_s00141p00084440 [Amborella trichopoda]